MDAAHPIGACRRNGLGRKGCGRVLLTFDPAERLDAQRRRHRIMVTRQHHRHAQGEVVSPYCDHCNRLGWSYAPA